MFSQYLTIFEYSYEANYSNYKIVFADIIYGESREQVEKE